MNPYRLLTGLLVLSMLLGGTALAQDEESQIGVAGILTDDASYEGEISEGDSMHLYAFQAAAEQEIIIDMRQTSGELDPLLLLLRPDGQLVAWDDDGGEFPNARISTTLEEEGVYFVLASTLFSLYPSSDEAAQGEYEVSITGADEDPQMNPDDLDIPSITLDTPIPGLLSADRPYVMSYLTVQDSITVDLSAPSADVDTLLYVFDPNGKRIAVDDDGGEDGSSAYIASLPLTEPGEYLVIVSTFDAHKAGEEETFAEGDFDLIVQRTEAG